MRGQNKLQKHEKKCVLKDDNRFVEFNILKAPKKKRQMSFQMKNCDNSKEIRVESPWRGQKITQSSTTKSQHREGVTFFQEGQKKFQRKLKAVKKSSANEIFVPIFLTFCGQF